MFRYITPTPTSDNVFYVIFTIGFLCKILYYAWDIRIIELEIVECMKFVLL